MKKLLLLFIGFIIIINTNGQDLDQSIILDSGYYYGVVKDSVLNKFLFISFLSNGGDNILYIVPYIVSNDVKDISFIHKDFIQSLSVELMDSVDGNILRDNKWSIPGFDNYSYYNIRNKLINFSLNIVSLDSKFINVFIFRGLVLDNGDINSIITSTDSTFQNESVLLTYKKLQDEK